MHEEYIMDPRLSLKAKGLLTIMLDFQECGLTLQQVESYPTSDKDNTVNSAINELKKYCYLMEVTLLKGDRTEKLGWEAFRFAQTAPNKA